MKKRYLALFVILALVAGAFAQNTEHSGTATPSQPQTSKAPDQAAAYYHFTLGHMYEDMATVYGRSEYFNRAVDEYRLAITYDPSSGYLTSALAELYAKSGRIRDAVLEAQDILSRDPSNLDARRLLGRIYLRSLGDMQAGAQSAEILTQAIEQYQQIVKLDPGSVEDRLLLGRLYRLNNQSEKAEAQFKAALQLQPYSEEAVTTLAYLYNEEDNSAEAAKVLSSIPEADRSSRLYAALGFTYEQQKDTKQAVAAYRKAVELDQDNLDAVRGLAQNLASDGQNDAALEQYKIILDADPQDAQTYMRMAEIYRHDGKFDLALESLKKAKNLVQDSLEVPYNIAVVYAAQGRFDDAVHILQDLAAKTEKADGNYTSGERNNRALFLERLGGIYRDNGKFTEAIDVFRKMLNLGEDNEWRGYQEMVDTYRDAREWRQATATAKEAVDKLPENRDLKLTLASQMADTGEGDQAIQAASSLLKHSPEDRDVYVSLAQICSRLKRYQEAEDFITKASQLPQKPEDKQAVYFVWGSIFDKQKKFEAAEAMFKKVLADDAKNAPVLNYLGYMLADRGVRLQEALGYLKTAVSLEPQNGAYLDSLGWTYFKLGDYAQAEDNLRHALESMSRDPTVQDHIAEVYARTGRLKLAATHWERAIEEWNRSIPAEVDPNDVQRVQKKLESAKTKLAKQQPERKAEATKP